MSHCPYDLEALMIKHSKNNCGTKDKQISVTTTKAVSSPAAVISGNHFVSSTKCFVLIHSASQQESHTFGLPSLFTFVLTSLTGT